MHEDACGVLAWIVQVQDAARRAVSGERILTPFPPPYLPYGRAAASTLVAMGRAVAAARRSGDPMTEVAEQNYCAALDTWRGVRMDLVGQMGIPHHAVPPSFDLSAVPAVVVFEA